MHVHAYQEDCCTALHIQYSCQYVHPLRQEATTAVQEAPKKEDTAGEDDAQYGNSQVSRAGMGARRAVQSYRHTGCRKGEKGGWCWVLNGTSFLMRLLG